MMTNYLPEICFLLFSLFPTFVLQTLVLSTTFSCCYLTPFAYFLKPQTSSYISSTNYGRPCQMYFCILSMPFKTLSFICCSFLISFYQLIICPLSPLIFFSTPFVPLATITHFPDSHTVHY